MTTPSHPTANQLPADQPSADQLSADQLSANQSPASAAPAAAEKVLCPHCQRTATNGIKCQGICVADSNY